MLFLFKGFGGCCLRRTCEEYGQFGIERLLDVQCRFSHRTSGWFGARILPRSVGKESTCFWQFARSFCLQSGNSGHSYRYLVNWYSFQFDGMTHMVTLHYRTSRFDCRIGHCGTFLCQHHFQYWPTVRSRAYSNCSARTGYRLRPHRRLRGSYHLSLHRRSRKYIHCESLRCTCS